jgi:hypothetical protein
MIANNVLAPNATSDRFTGVVPTDVIDVASLGEGLVVVRNTKVAFDNDLAQKVLSLKDCPWERGLRNNHVSFLISEMKKGTFLTELANLAVCVCDEDNGEEYRINGQHTCWARLEVPESEFPAKPITVLKYRATTRDDMRRLYASFDRGAPRTKSNIIEAYLEGTEQFSGAGRSVVKLVASGLTIWLWETKTERDQHTADDVAFLMQKDHAEVVNLVVGFCELDPKIAGIKWMRRASIAAAMLETFSKAKKPSEEFWHAIKVGVGFQSQSDPRLRLRNALTTSSVYAVQDKDKKKTDQESIYRWCIVAWNAWRAGEEIKVLRASKKRQRAK